MKRLLVLVATLALATSPAAGQEAAGAGAVLSGLRSGRGWVGIPIENGKGTFRTTRVPTMALTVAGCLNVWYGHSGTWEIEARENVLGSVIRLDAEPGVGVPFEHDFGMQAQVDIEFRWSEPRDTTLMLWVALDLEGNGARSVCEPEYGSGGR